VYTEWKFINNFWENNADGFSAIQFMFVSE
jgi:hypothetical protein